MSGLPRTLWLLAVPKRVGRLRGEFAEKLVNFYNSSTFFSTASRLAVHVRPAKTSLHGDSSIFTSATHVMYVLVPIVLLPVSGKRNMVGVCALSVCRSKFEAQPTGNVFVFARQRTVLLFLCLPIELHVGEGTAPKDVFRCPRHMYRIPEP